MKILFFARYNLDQLGGGDRVQLLKTKEALERRGHEVVVSTRGGADLTGFDIVHIFNIQISPTTLYAIAKKVKKQGVPLAFSTIYWNPGEWFKSNEGRPQPKSRSLLQTYRAVKGGMSLMQLLGLVLSDRLVRRWFRQLLRTRDQDAASADIKRWLVQNADIILPNGQSELEMVERDFGRSQLGAVIPNGVEDLVGAADGQAFLQEYNLSEFVLSVGRIESRKNAVALAAAATKLQLPLVMIGNDSIEPAYAAQVKEIAKDAVFIPEMPQQQLGAAYKAAKVHAMVSWFETPGLSSLEAGVAGCNIVSTERGTTREYFGDMAWYCDPADQSSIEQALRAAWEAPKSDALREHLLKSFHWDVVGEKTEAAYQQIIR